MLIPKEVDHRCPEFNWVKYHEFTSTHTSKELEFLELQNVFAEKFKQVTVVAEWQRLLCKLGKHRWLKVEALFTVDHWYKICLEPACTVLYLYTDLSSSDIVRTRIILTAERELEIHKAIRSRYNIEMQELRSKEDKIVTNTSSGKVLVIYDNKGRDITDNISLGNIEHSSGYRIPKRYVYYKDTVIGTLYPDDDRVVMQDYKGGMPEALIKLFPFTGYMGHRDTSKPEPGSRFKVLDID